MADALVSFMLEKLATVIQDEIQQEVSLVVGAEEELKKLTTTFQVIQGVLNDAEQRQIKDEAVKVWLEEFKDIAYDMDDVLDEWSFEILRSQIDTGVGNKKKVSSYLRSLCSCFSKIALRHNIGTRIKDIRERLDLAESEKHKYHLVEMKSNENPIKRFKSSSLINVFDIYGRLEDKKTIMSKLMLLGESSGTTNTNQQETSNLQALQAPKIISIVGMGGLGKTTLAQLVFNDDQVKTHFEKIMWVCVSDPFDRVTVTKAIIEEAKCEVPNSSEWQTLHHRLSESVQGKLFLLVLDDVWTDDQINWEPLKLALSYGAQGSRVLVTTRNEKVALMMNASYTHFLGVLSDDDCSSLLNRIALAGENKKNHEDLREIGDKISKKCKGLPLAAKTLGGLLHFKKNKKEWLSILESEIWELEEVENGFLKPALLLSYYDLPLPLKGCFVYCSIFPKDYKFKKDFLIKLWMAQGFVKSTNANEELEMIGEDYFNNLAMRSFFQDLSKDNDGNIYCCKMHDLVHDFAQFLTKNECAFTQYSSGTQILNPSNRVRHLTLVCEEETRHIKDSYNYLISSIHKAKKLRTLQIYNLQIQEAPADLFNHLRCLKVLCLDHIGLENLSSEIVNLIHLRYLDLSNNKKLKILPETVSSLYNLQTLKLKGCEYLCKLPREMWRMINLRHLDIRKTNELSHIPRGIGRLSSLKTLSDFIVGGTSDGCKIGELKELNLLQGRLSIRGLGRVETVNEAFGMGLKQKHLHTLTLGFKPNEKTENGLEESLENLQRMEDVLEVLEPHPDLVELEITHYLGFRLSSWIGNTLFLCHIRTLKLYDCINLTKLPAFGQLPSLEVLDINRSNKVKHIGHEFYTNSVEHVTTVAFPKLKELYMVGMNNLEVWELEHGVVMPCLRRIRLIGCTKLKALPALGKLPSLEELIIFEANQLMHIGYEFLYENDEAGGERFNNIAFPKLKYLGMRAKKLQWDFMVMAGTREEIIMPCLRSVDFGGCKNLKPLVEVLSKMPSLEILEITGEATEFITCIGHHDDADDGLHVTREILFRNLKKLTLSHMVMEELKLGFEVMPSLTSLQICDCEKLKANTGPLKVGNTPSKELFITL